MTVASTATPEAMGSAFVSSVILSNGVLHGLTLGQETIGRDQTGQGLFFAIPTGLPPMRVSLIYDMEDIAFDKTNTEFPTRNIWIIMWIVVDVGLQTNQNWL